MKKLSCIFALLLWYGCISAMPAKPIDAGHKRPSFTTLKSATPAGPDLIALKASSKFSIKLKYNHRKKAMRGDEIAWSAAGDCDYKVFCCTGTDLFFIQTDYFLRPCFGHSKRGPPAIR